MDHPSTAALRAGPTPRTRLDPNRREALAQLAVVTALALGGVGTAHAESFPSQTVKVVVPLTPGGSNDVLARVLAERLAALWKHTVVVENRPGGSSNIGADLVARAQPDGHTLLVAPNNVFVSNHLVSPKLDAGRALEPVAVLGSVPFVLVVRPEAGVSTAKELVERSKQRPDGMTYATSGVASPHHLLSEAFRAATGAKLTHVPYKGAAPAIADLLAGQVDLQFGAINQLLPHIRGGKLKALAVAGSERAALLPDVPTLAEAGVPGQQPSIWVGLAAPPRTPPALVERMSRDVAQVLAQPGMAAPMSEQGIALRAGSQAEMAKLIADDTREWGRVIEAANIRTE